MLYHCLPFQIGRDFCSGAFRHSAGMAVYRGALCRDCESVRRFILADLIGSNNVMALDDSQVLHDINDRNAILYVGYIMPSRVLNIKLSW